MKTILISFAVLASSPLAYQVSFGQTLFLQQSVPAPGPCLPPQQNVFFVAVATGGEGIDTCNYVYTVTNGNVVGPASGKGQKNVIVQFNNVNDNGSVKVTTSGCNSSEFSDTKTGSICYLGPAGTIALNGNSANPQELPCGSQPVTFTTSSVTNANNYNWNYSSLQNSGWTYVSGQGTTTLSMNSNGSSGGTINMTASRANASITATTPTLTVTRPVAGGNASGIFGDGYLCSGETKSYSINSLPIGANVTWSVSPNLSLPAGNTGNPVIIGYNYDGAGTITATINDDCGQATRSTTVQSGVFTTSQYTISGDNQVCPNGDAYVY